MASVYERRDGNWCAQYRIDTVGGRKTKYLYAKTEKQARGKLDKALAEVARHDGGTVPDAGNLKVGDYLDRWYTSHSRDIRASSARRYEENIRLHIKPALGEVRLCKLNALQLEQLYHDKLDAGYSSKTVHYIHTTVHAALKRGVKWSLLSGNVADAATPPQPKNAEIAALSKEEVKTLLDAARGERLEALYVLAVTSGLRIGEALALKWDDVDLDAGTLKIRRTLSYKSRIEAPKTEKSKRTIKLSRMATEALRDHAEQSGESDWIFASGAGKPIHQQHVHSRHWKPLLKRAGLPPSTRFRDLRHTAATLMLGQGVNVKVVSQMLGHGDNIAFTLRVYTHTSAEAQSKAADAMDVALG